MRKIIPQVSLFVTNEPSDCQPSFKADAANSAKHCETNSEWSVTTTSCCSGIIGGYKSIVGTAIAKFTEGNTAQSINNLNYVRAQRMQLRNHVKLIAFIVVGAQLRVDLVCRGALGRFEKLQRRHLEIL
jgi:hypothetical protein